MNKAEEYLHQSDRDGMPLTRFTWDAMIECYNLFCELPVV